MPKRSRLRKTKQDPLDQIPMSDINRHLKEEEANFSNFAIGSKGYDKVCDRIALLEVIKERKMKKRR